MIKKVTGMVCLTLGSLLTVLGCISVYSFVTQEVVWFALDTVVREEWATVHRVGMLVPSVWNLIFTVVVVVLLFGAAYFLLRRKGTPGSY